MKPTSLHTIKISQETFFSSIMFKSVPDDRDQGGKYDFLFYTELHILVKTIELQNQSVFFYNKSLDAWMTMAGAILALVW